MKHVLMILMVTVCSSSSAWGQDPSALGECSLDVVTEDVQFATRQGSDPNLTSLATFSVSGRVNAPIIVFIHGGGWVSGDKDEIMDTPIVDAFLSDGAVVVAANYRPVQAGNGVRYDEQADDVAAALAWVHTQAETFGGDPKRILLIGFSSGAHLVSLVATDPRYLAAYGMTVNHLSGVVALDVPAYHVPRAIASAAGLGWPSGATSLQTVFTNDLALQRDASPELHIPDAASRPPFLVVSAQYQPSPSGLASTSFSRVMSEMFVTALVNAGTAAEHVHVLLSHTDLVMTLGEDNTLTTTVWDFWKEVDVVQPELVVNGGFEAPAVTTSQGWDIFPTGTSGLGWNVSWTSAVPFLNQRCTRPLPKLEVQRGNVVGFEPFTGKQAAELDTDWNGPNSNQSCSWLIQEPANVSIWQDVPTCEGQTYTLTYAWRPRPMQRESRMVVSLNAQRVGEHVGHQTFAQAWNSVSIQFVATGTSTRLRFSEVGLADSMGMILDAVSVRGPSCAPPPC